MRRIFDWLLLAALIGSMGYGVYTHQSEVESVLHALGRKVAPCARPVTYSLGSIDPRFGIGSSTVLRDIEEAERIWEAPSGKNLFAYAPTGGEVTVNLVYDSRQAATDKLKATGLQIDKSKASYDSLKASYDALSVRVRGEQVEYARQVAAYRSHENAYNAEVAMWNERGGAPKTEYERLQEEKVTLAQEFEQVQALESAMNAEIDTLNALATTLNQRIVQLHLNVAQYNRVGAAAGEFEEGLYQRIGTTQTIDVYEYSTRTQLVRVLAHELGHALELEHVSDPDAVMYKLNQGESLTATTDDLAELNRICAPGT